MNPTPPPSPNEPEPYICDQPLFVPPLISICRGRLCDPPDIKIHDKHVMTWINSVWKSYIGSSLPQLKEREPQGVRADNLLYILNRLLRVVEGNAGVTKVKQEVEEVCNEFLQACRQIRSLSKQLLDTEFVDGPARSFYFTFFCIKQGSKAFLLGLSVSVTFLFHTVTLSGLSFTFEFASDDRHHIGLEWHWVPEYRRYFHFIDERIGL